MTHTKLLYWALNIISLYSKFIGFTTIGIDYKKKCLKTSKLFCIFISVCHIIVLAGLPIAMSVNFTHVRLTDKNHVLTFANSGIIISRMILMLQLVLMRKKRDFELKSCLEKLVTIQTWYFERFTTIPADRQLRKWLLLNFLLMITHTSRVGYTAWSIALFDSWAHYLDVYIGCIVLTLQHIIMLQHTAFLCYIYECLSKLNYQLQHNINDPKLSLIYYQLTAIVEDCNCIFSPVILCVHICSIITNSMMGFFCFFKLLNPHHDDVIDFDYIIVDTSYLMLCFHMYIYFLICNHVTNVTNQTNLILKDLLEYGAQDNEEVIMCDSHLDIKKKKM